MRERPETAPPGILGFLSFALLFGGVLLPLPISIMAVEWMQKNRGRPPLTALAGGLAACGFAALFGLGIIRWWRAVQPGPVERCDANGLACLVSTQLFALSVVGIAWARQHLPPPLGGRGEWTVVVAIASSAALVLFMMIAVDREVRRRRDPARVSPVARARIHELRDGGARLRDIADGLDREGLGAPGGRWTGLLLRAVIRDRPVSPPR